MPNSKRAQADDLEVVRDDDIVPVALGGLSPMYAHGLNLVLQTAGLACTVLTELERLTTLLAGAQPYVVVVPQSLSAVLLPAVPGGSRHEVVVLLEDVDPDSFAHALHAGATGVLRPQDSPDDVLAVLRCAGRGLTLLPREVARALSRPAAAVRPSLSPDEQAWLRRLAAGGTVAALARGCGFSEREMYRRLSAVYRRLGARSRTQAMLLAERHGLLDEPA